MKVCLCMCLNVFFRVMRGEVNGCGMSQQMGLGVSWPISADTV